MNNLNHFNTSGEAHMVNINSKLTSNRKAIASGRILMKAKTLKVIKSGDAKKGDVIGIARIAAIQGCKKTSELIPLCHQINILGVDVEFSFHNKPFSVGCKVIVECVGKTGVEMEAINGVQIGLLTIYDMLKGIDREMVISDIKLEEKIGGKTGQWKREKSKK